MVFTESYYKYWQLFTIHREPFAFSLKNQYGFQKGPGNNLLLGKTCEATEHFCRQENNHALAKYYEHNSLTWKRKSYRTRKNSEMYINN